MPFIVFSTFMKEFSEEFESKGRTSLGLPHGWSLGVWAP